MEKLIKTILRKVRTASLNYHLVEAGDRIAVAMSGGKDSMALLYFLNLLKQRVPFAFELIPVYIDLGWENQVGPMTAFCSVLGYPLQVKFTAIGKIVFDLRQEKSPCALCANLRRGAINRTAAALGCNKVALGHHLDDAVNTLFMSLLYERRYRVFKPLTYLDRMDITFIRPFIYVEENEIKNFSTQMNIPSVPNQCPADGNTKRAEVSRLLNLMENAHPGLRQKILAGIEQAEPDSFWKPFIR